MIETEAQATSGNLAHQNNEVLWKRIEGLQERSGSSFAGRKIKATDDHLEHTKEIARKIQDPARIRAQKQLKKLNDKYVDLWNIKNRKFAGGS